MRRLAILLALAVLVAACGNDTDASQPVVGEEGETFPVAPATPAGGLAANARDAVDAFATQMQDALLGRSEPPPESTFADIAAAGDPRVAWLLSDYLRFVPQANPIATSLTDAASVLTGTTLDTQNPWNSLVNNLIAWDLPAYPGYREDKASLFTLVEDGWEPFFADENSGIDWRLVSWGGVLIDDREFGDPNPCLAGCIPALDDPAVTDAAGGDWYPDERIVFGVQVGDEARAYPRNLMEVHEMVNDELGGRRIAMPYCTLCGSAQAYFVDDLADDVAMPVLRTSGLLTRSNKVMYDLETASVFDTFTGEALSGPLQDAGVTLTQISVVTSTWGDWKAAHPDTTIVAEDGGIGRSYPLDPLQGRDDDGPIFPIGDVDPRLPVQEKVLGITSPDGDPVAFPVDAALAALAEGRDVSLAGVRVVTDGAGARAETLDGDPVVTHEAFWFAWAQFMPDTLLWADG